MLLNYFHFLSQKMLNHSGPYHFVQKVGFFKYLQDLSLCPYKSTTRVILHLMTYGDINCEETMLLNYFHFLSQKMLNHSGPYHFVQKVGFFKYLQDLSLCPYKSTTRVILHLMTYRDINCEETMLLNYFHFLSQKMLNHSGPYHFVQKVGFFKYLQDLSLCPYKSTTRVILHLMTYRDINCEETMLLNYFHFLSQKMLNHSGPYHFVQKVGFFKYLQDLSLCPYKSTTRVILHLMTYRDINCEETMLLNYFHFLSQKMLNHSGPYHFVQKVGFFKYLQDLSLCPYRSTTGVILHLMTYRDINCEETMLLNYFHFLSQKMLNHSGPYHFVQKVGFFKYLQDLSLCPYKSTTRVILHLMTYRDINCEETMLLNYFHFLSQKMLNHSGPYHFVQKVGFFKYLQDLSLCPYKSTTRVILHLMTYRDINCEETMLLNYFHFLSQKMLNHSGPYHFVQKVGFFKYLQDLSLCPYKSTTRVILHLMTYRDINCEETMLLNYFHFLSQKMLNHSGPYHFVQKVGFFKYLQDLSLCPYKSTTRVILHLMTYRDINCEETYAIELFSLFISKKCLTTPDLTILSKKWGFSNIYKICPYAPTKAQRGSYSIS